jgi:hypothetical protein
VKIEQAGRLQLQQRRPLLFVTVHGINLRRHKTCTTENDPDGKLWCSTRTTPDDYHVGRGGFWGYCSDDCVNEKELEEVRI